MSCQPAPLLNKLANPPYSIHNFAWKEGISNNDDARVKLVDGNLTAQLDTKAISVTASKRAHLVWTRRVVYAAHCYIPYIGVMVQRLCFVHKHIDPRPDKIMSYGSGSTVSLCQWHYNC
jgi:hypothetical protein